MPSKKSALARLIDAINNDPDLRRQMVKVYDAGQDNATDHDEYQDMLKSGDEEGAVWHAHDYAIEKLWMFLADSGVIDPESVSEADVSYAFAEASR